jgi:hypothetical protein
VSLAFPSHTYSLSGTLPYDCGVGAELPGLDGNGLFLFYSMDVTNFSDSFTGTVYDANGSWGASLTAYRAATNLSTNSPVVPGQYVLSIPGDHAATNNHPGGDSFATYSINDKGVVVWNLSLADNTTVLSHSTAVSTNGIWPLYAPLYKNNGIILGWQTNGAPTNSSGSVEWFKPAAPAKAGAYYTNGFAWQYNSTPASYTPPAAGSQYQIVFDGGTLTGPLTNLLTVSQAGQFTNTAGQAKNLGLTLTRSSGALTGQFVDPADNALKKINGAFVSPESGGSGCILDTDDETGYFEMSLAPAR